MRRKHQGLARTPDRHGFRKALPLWRRSICHHKIFNTRQDRQQNLSRLVCFCVCARVWQLSVRICVWVAGIEVCASLISMCALGENGCFVLFVTMVFSVLSLVSVWFLLSTNSQQMQNKRAGTTRWGMFFAKKLVSNGIILLRLATLKFESSQRPTLILRFWEPQWRIWIDLRWCKTRRNIQNCPSGLKRCENKLTDKPRSKAYTNKLQHATTSRSNTRPSKTLNIVNEVTTSPFESVGQGWHHVETSFECVIVIVIVNLKPRQT